MKTLRYKVALSDKSPEYQLAAEFPDGEDEALELWGSEGVRIFRVLAMRSYRIAHQAKVRTLCNRKKDPMPIKDAIEHLGTRWVPELYETDLDPEEKKLREAKKALAGLTKEQLETLGIILKEGEA